MKIRYYFGVAIVYILLCLFGIYYLTDYKYQLQLPYFGGIDLTLSVGLWICLLLVVLLLISIISMSIFVIEYKFKAMKQNRDYSKIIAQIREQMLFNPIKERVFGDNNYKELHTILNKFTLVPKLDSQNSKNEKIESIFKIFDKINSGECEDAKSINLAENHPSYLINLKNMASSSASNAYKVLEENIKADINTILEIHKIAWSTLLNSKNIKLLSKALKLPGVMINFDILNNIVNAETNENIFNKDEIIFLFQKAKLNDREYLNIAINLSKNFKEENISLWLSIFDKLSKTDENSIFSYFYILLTVGKTNEALELKEQFQKQEYLSVLAFNDLKNKGYPLLLFFEPFIYMDSSKKSQ